MTTASTAATTTTTSSSGRRRRTRRTPEQMLAELQAKLAEVKARAERKAAAASIEKSTPTPASRTTTASKRRAAKRAKRAESMHQPAGSTPSSAPVSTRTSLPTSVAPTRVNLLTNSLHADLQSCLDAFSVDLVDLIQRSTLEAVQRVLGELGKSDSADDVTGNEPLFSAVSARTPARSAKSAGASGPAASKLIASKSTAASTAAPLTFKAYERMAIERAIVESGGNVSAAAKLLGLNGLTIYRRFKRCGLKTQAAGGRYRVSPADSVARAGEPVSFDAYRKAVILRAIDQCDGDCLAAARLLKISSATMYAHMRVLGIQRSKGPGARYKMFLDIPVARAGELVTLESKEGTAIVAAINECGGDVGAAAKRLKCSMPTLYRRMKVFGIRKIKGPGR